jgi:type II secretory pathway pseudopilin PulG
MSRKNKHVLGISMTLVEVLVVVAVIVVLVALLLPFLANSRHHLPGQRCQNNLKQIALATMLWANDQQDKLPWEISTNNGGSKEWLMAGLVHRHYQVLSNELGNPKILVCNSEEGWSAATNFDSPQPGNVSYFVGTSARLGLPKSLLGGDRCLVAKEKKLTGNQPLSANQKLTWDESVHGSFGAIALADGSAYRTKSKELRERLHDSGLATNWVVIP